MKRTTMLLAAATLGATILAVDRAGNLRAEAESQTPVSAMGFLISDDERPVGWYTFPITDASNPAKIKETDAVSAGAMAWNTYYAMSYTPGPVPLAWNTVDVSSGEFTKLADCTEEHPLYVDMTYDYSDGNLLAIYHYGGNSSKICIVDPADGTPTEYADAGTLWLMTLACSYDGDIYTLANNGHLYRYDKGARRLVDVGDTGKSMEYMQSMEFDHSDGTLYWAASTYSDGYFYKIDPRTAEVTFVSSMGKEGELTGLYIPFSLAEDGAPAAVDFEVTNPAHDGVADIRAVLPSATAGGQSLETILSIVLEVDGIQAKTWPGTGMTPGSEVSLQAEVAEGMHAFRLYAVNEAGNGLPRTQRCFIGEDVPAAPAGVKVEADGNAAAISWDAVVTGAAGGWVNTASLGYDVVRMPGSHVVATGVKTTSCADEVPATGVYTYTVTAVSGKGRSEAGSSAPIVVGTELDVPYSYDFENEDDLLMWTIADANNDGATWARGNTYAQQRTMMMRGNYGRTADDWLISPAVRLEAGKAYKIVYDAGCMNAYYPASYSVTIGRDAATEGHTVIKQLTTDLVNLNKTYVYLPEIEETGAYHIGFHAAWEPGLPTLYISNFTLEENRASWLTATVTDGTSPLAGATVKFGDPAATYVTDEQGRFEIIEIEPGTYPLSVEKFGFEPVSASYTFAPLEHKEETIAMTAIATASVSGKVVDAAGRGVENATVSVHGYDSYNVQTDRDGNFTAEGVYRKGGYTIDAHALNYETASRSIESLDGDIDLGSFMLQEKLIAPANVAVESDRANAVLTWDAPQDLPVEFRYDDGTDDYVFNMEMSAATDHTVVGVVYDTPAVFTSMSWNVWNSGDNGRPVDVVVFDLDEDGKPTNHILYEENGLESENYNWHECVFKYPVVAPRGALFALRGDARLCMDHAGENPDWPARLDKMVLCKDYRTEPFNSIYPEGDHIFRGNLTLRAAGLPYGAPRKVAAETPSHSYDVWRLLPGQESEPSQWTKLNSAPVAATTFSDPTWAAAPKGTFRFAVKTVYADGNVSYPAFSGEVPHLLHSAVELTFATNVPGEDASAAAVVLAGKGNTYSYSGMADESGVVRINGVREGAYVLTCTKKGFEALEEDIEVSGDVDFSQSFTLKEATKAPANLVIEAAATPDSRLLKWNVVTGIFDDFEDHDDFEINSPGDAGWTYIDGDGVPTYSSPDYDYPNAREPMAFIVMNPSKTVPSMLDADFLDTHSGDKVLVCMAPGEGTGVNDDYIVSPRLEMGGDFVVSFWVRGYWWRYEETLRVGYSTDGNEAEDFVWVGEPVKVDFDDWQQIVTTIPREARHVAINCISDNAYYLAIDDIYIGAADNIPGVTAAAMRAPGKATGYDVYLDGVKLASTTATEYLLENLTDGTHTAGVTARFASGDTEMSTIDFAVLLSGIGDVESAVVKVSARGGKIHVAGAPEGSLIRIVRPDGAVVAAVEASNGAASVPVASGVYIVTVGDIVFRVTAI